MEDRASVFMYYGTTHHLYIVVSRSDNHVHTMTWINLYSRPPKKRENILPQQCPDYYGKTLSKHLQHVVLYAVYFNY